MRKLSLTNPPRGGLQVQIPPKKRASGEKLTQAAMTYIDAHSAEKFSLQAVASALFVNGSYLLRTFKSHTGSTLLAYHNAVRCEKAKVLLLDPAKSISQAGEEVGFVSSSHFSHIFKKVTGLTPTEYRREHGNVEI